MPSEEFLEWTDKAYGIGDDTNPVSVWNRMVIEAQKEGATIPASVQREESQAAQEHRNKGINDKLFLYDHWQFVAEDAGAEVAANWMYNTVEVLRANIKVDTEEHGKNLLDGFRVSETPSGATAGGTVSKLPFTSVSMAGLSAPQKWTLIGGLTLVTGGLLYWNFKE